MGNVICYCAHCKTKLDVDESWCGKDLQCPVCEKIISIPPQEDPIESLQTDSEHTSEKAQQSANTPPAERSACRQSKRKYPLGRTGVIVSKILAVLSILSGAVLTFMLAKDYSLAVESIPEYQILEKSGKELNFEEKKLQKSFADTVQRLYGFGNIDSKGTFGGIKLPKECTSITGVMPLSLFSLRDRNRATSVLAEYQKKLQSIKQSFIESFGKSFTSANVPAAASSRIVIRTSGEKIKFYTEEYRKSTELDRFINTLGQMKNDKTLPKNALADIRRAEAVGIFLKQHLFPNRQLETVVYSTPVSSSTTASAVDSTRLHYAAIVIQDLANGWQLEKIISNINTILQQSQYAGTLYDRKQSLLRQKLVKELFALWMKVFLAVFILTVLSDYLKAHFDKVEILEKIAENTTDSAV